MKFKNALNQTYNNFKQSIPILLGVILLIAMITTAVPTDIFKKIFSGNFIFDSLIGAAIGSIAAGNPITSYVIGGELLVQGISLIAVTAFILTWVTIGIVQMPAEILMLGKRFAITRNILAFLSAIIISILTVLTLRIFS
jgi:uncharacterized membrane protein YraQ (UPF0718 family)